LILKCPPEGGRYKNVRILSSHTDSEARPYKASQNSSRHAMNLQSSITENTEKSGGGAKTNVIWPEKACRRLFRLECDAIPLCARPKVGLKNAARFLGKKACLGMTVLWSYSASCKVCSAAWRPMASGIRHRNFQPIASPASAEIRAVYAKLAEYY